MARLEGMCGCGDGQRDFMVRSAQVRGGGAVRARAFRERITNGKCNIYGRTPTVGWVPIVLETGYYLLSLVGTRGISIDVGSFELVRSRMIVFMDMGPWYAVVEC